MLAKTSYIANCFYSAARVRRSHRQGRAGCYPVMLMGTTSQQDAAPCTVSWVFSSTSVMLSSCLHSRFVLSLHFAYRLQLKLSSCLQSAILCVCVLFVVISLTSFMLSSCLRSLFQFCILVFHVVSAMASTLMSPRPL